jgi:2'-5' RNA ligase
MNAGTLRAFVAAPLPGAATEALGRLAARLEQAGLRGRWVPPGNIHLTFHFLGDVPLADVDPLAAALERAARDAVPIRLAPSGLGVFPRPQRARVLWVGLGGELDRLGILQRRVETELARLGHAPEGRAWTAHLTLARARGEFDAQRLARILQTHATLEVPAFQIDSLVLFRSDLGPGGARYTPLARAVLGRDPGPHATGGGS